MHISNFRSTALKQIRIVDPQPEDQPNTPSKSKVLPRRWHRPAALLLTALLAGTVLLLRGPGQTRAGSHRSALDPRSAAGLAAAQVGSGDGNFPSTTLVQKGAARQREALEIADDILLHHSMHTTLPEGQRPAGLESLSAGGGSVDLLDEQPMLHIEEDEPLLPLDAPVTEQRDVPDPQTPPPLYQRRFGESHGVGASAGSPSTVLVTHTTSTGQERQLVVPAARFTDLEALSKGLESQDVEPTGALHRMWWAEQFSADGDVAPPLARSLEGATAALSAVRAQRSIEAEQASDEQCSIYVLDVAAELGAAMGAPSCDLSSPRIWPFSQPGAGIDGADVLPPQHYQYAAEYWIAQAIRSSGRHAADIASADFVFVDMWCYHTAWLAYIHPLGSANTSNPEPYMRRGLDLVTKTKRFAATKGADFGMVHPSPVMRGFFSEETVCEELASVYGMVPERSSLCVWTQDSASEGTSAILPYVATMDVDLEADLEAAARGMFLFFRGGCGHPDSSVRELFTAGKMMRYALVEALRALGAADVAADCSCDICDNHLPHTEVMAQYRRARFCPVLPSNAQSSRGLSEAVLSGCVPVFLGPPFHSLPLAQDVDYAAMAVFINVTHSTWINHSSPHHLQNHMVARVWKLDDPAVHGAVVSVPTLQDAVQYLRAMPEEEVAAKRRAVLRDRLKFYYGAAPKALGGDGRASELGELLMKRMCRRAAAAKRRMQAAAAAGLSTLDSSVRVTPPLKLQQQKSASKSWAASWFGK